MDGMEKKRNPLMHAIRHTKLRARSSELTKQRAFMMEYCWTFGGCGLLMIDDRLTAFSSGRFGVARSTNNPQPHATELPERAWGCKQANRGAHPDRLQRRVSAYCSYPCAERRCQLHALARFPGRSLNPGTTPIKFWMSDLSMRLAARMIRPPSLTLSQCLMQAASGMGGGAAITVLIRRGNGGEWCAAGRQQILILLQHFT